MLTMLRLYPLHLGFLVEVLKEKTNERAIEMNMVRELSDNHSVTHIEIGSKYRGKMS